MQQKITGYHKDLYNGWVAELQCRHNQHVRHNPPFISRPWTTTKSGRDSMLGTTLRCKKCEENAPQDY